jgi:hypothetical protein
VGFVVDKSALGQVFSEYFGFPCQSFHRLLHTHYPSSGAVIIAKYWPTYEKDSSLTPTQGKKQRLIIIIIRLYMSI